MREAHDLLEVRFRELSQRHVASIRTTTQSRPFERTVAMLHELVMDAVGEQGLAPAGPLFARFHRSGATVDVEAGVPLAQPITPTGVVLASSLPGGPALTVLLSGDHRARDTSRAMLVMHALRQGYGVRGAPWENYLVDECDTPIPSEWLTEICLPVARALPPVATRERAAYRMDRPRPYGERRPPSQ